MKKIMLELDRWLSVKEHLLILKKDLFGSQHIRQLTTASNYLQGI